MKPTGRSDFAFDSGLVVCLKDDIENCELSVSFEELLSLQLAAGVHSLLFLASQIQKEHTIEDLLYEKWFLPKKFSFGANQPFLAPK